MTGCWGVCVCVGCGSGGGGGGRCSEIKQIAPVLLCFFFWGGVTISVKSSAF